MASETGEDVDQTTAGQLWIREVLMPTMHRAHQAVGGHGTAVQAYCDLLEVRYLLSERAARDVGIEVALDALATGRTPVDSAARLGVAETPTAEIDMRALMREIAEG